LDRGAGAETQPTKTANRSTSQANVRSVQKSTAGPQMNHDLTLHEARIIGVLLEKEITTPDQYPLSLNALTNACNQKSNRHPVMELEEATVRQALDRLLQRGLVWAKNTAGGRVEKYKQRFCNTEFSSLKLSARQTAIICELLLRGPQTPGELRSRAGRMAPFAHVREVEAALQGLMERDGGPLVAMLPREPGRRESRYRHLFSDADAAGASPDPGAASGDAKADSERIAELEARVEHLEQENAALRQRLRELGQMV